MLPLTLGTSRAKPKEGEGLLMGQTMSEIGEGT